MKATYVNINGIWKKIKNVWINVNGTWKEKIVLKGNINNTWKDFINYYNEVVYATFTFTRDITWKYNGICKIDKNGYVSWVVDDFAWNIDGYQYHIVDIKKDSISIGGFTCSDSRILNNNNGKTFKKTKGLVALDIDGNIFRAYKDKYRIYTDLIKISPNGEEIFSTEVSKIYDDYYNREAFKYCYLDKGKIFITVTEVFSSSSGRYECLKILYTEGNIIKKIEIGDETSIIYGKMAMNINNIYINNSQGLTKVNKSSYSVEKIVFDEKIYDLCEDNLKNIFAIGLNKIYKIANTGDATPVWEKTYDFRFKAITATNNGFLYCGANDNLIVKIKASDGSVVWERKIIEHDDVKISSLKANIYEG